MDKKPVFPRPPGRAAGSLDLPDLVGAWIADCQLERSRRYLEHGRRFAGWTADALDAAWVQTYRAARGVPEDASREDDLQDLRCEFDLRGIEPPMHLVAAVADPFTERFEQRIRQHKSDPDAVAEMEEMLERLRDRLQAPKN